jgi:hypothetical protein
MTRRRRWPRWLASRRQRRRAGVAALVFLLLTAIWWRSDSERRLWPRTEILSAIRFVESGHRSNPPDGDGGLAIGPYQIHEVYWRDALRACPSLGGSYQDCRDRTYAERVITAYMDHYAAAAWERGDAEAIARTHNGGPTGPQRASTLGYWRKVRAALDG